MSKLHRHQQRIFHGKNNGRIYLFHDRYFDELCKYRGHGYYYMKVNVANNDCAVFGPFKNFLEAKMAAKTAWIIFTDSETLTNEVSK